jgi:hypothetical protein
MMEILIRSALILIVFLGILTLLHWFALGQKGNRYIELMKGKKRFLVGFLLSLTSPIAFIAFFILKIVFSL